MEIGSIIARLRKERRLTQEQLGQAIGVSGQAVSKWEKGGMPDAELLPAIADRLGVTIDTLFGREEKPTEDLANTINRHLRATPREKRMDALFQTLSRCAQSVYFAQEADIAQLLKHLPSQSCYYAEPLHPGEKLWLRSGMITEAGLELGVLSWECPMYLLMPEPPGGYEAHFAADEDYRRLFAALAMPGALEILRVLYAKKQSFYSTESLSRLAGIEPEAARAALEAMTGCNLLNQQTVELDTGAKEVYVLHNSEAFIPFLLFARWLLQETDAYQVFWKDRDRPLLKKREAPTNE